MALPTKFEISPLFVDKITFLVNPTDDRERYFANALEVIKRSKNSGIFCRAYAKGFRYRYNYELMVKKSAICLIQFSPLNANNSAFRFEINPQKASQKGRKLLKKFLARFFGNATEQLLGNAAISGLDVAVDLIGPRMENLMIYKDGTKKSGVYFGNQGEIETIYLGSPKSSRQIRFYNKTAEILARTGERPPEDIVRLEASLRPNRTSIKKLHLLSNPFSGTQIMRMRQPAVEDSTMFKLFVDACRVRGMVAALGMVNRSRTRQRLRERFCRRYRMGWWDPDATWDGLPAALIRLGWFPPAALGER